MSRVCQREKRRRPTLMVALILMLAASGALVWPLWAGSQAQQEPNRQLVQTGSTNASNSKRIALVIGNGAYANAPPLKNPPNDARDMAATLKALGFEVSSGVNVSQREMKRLIREFGQKLKAGGNGLFYYAGHGVQARGRNYIIPVDADIQSEADVEDSGVDVGLLLNYMDDAQNGLNIVILDACRNNPFARSFRSASSGLAQVDAPTGTLIAYATAPGRVAADGAGENGLYTSELLKAMRLPGLTATDMFMQVRAEVMKRTGNKQVPWEASSLVGTFYFKPAASGEGTTINSKPNATLADATTVEAEYWETIKESNDKTNFEDYLKEYPQGRYAPLARVKLRQLEAASKPSSAAGGNADLTSGPSNTSSSARPAGKPGAVVKNSIGVLNGKAINLPLPEYPSIARAARASGTVTVQVTIDEDGNVISAQAVSGHPLLRAAGVTAARQAKFAPTKVAGQPVKVQGVLTYNFTGQ